MKEKVTIDSTYLLPAVGVRVKKIPENPISTLLSSGYELVVNRISFFEATGKALREVEKEPKGKKPSRRLRTGLEILLTDERIQKVPVMDLKTAGTAISLREAGLDDLPDCLIASSAHVYSKLLLTESGDIEPARERAGVDIQISNWGDLFG